MPSILQLCPLVLSAESLPTWCAELFVGVFKVCVLPVSSLGTCLLLRTIVRLLGKVFGFAVALQVLLLLKVGGRQQHAGALLQALQCPPAAAPRWPGAAAQLPALLSGPPHLRAMRDKYRFAWSM